MITSVLLLAHSSMYQCIRLPRVDGDVCIEKMPMVLTPWEATSLLKLHPTERWAPKWSDLQYVIVACTCTSSKKYLEHLLCHIVVRGSLVINYDFVYDVEHEYYGSKNQKLSPQLPTYQILA